MGPSGFSYRSLHLLLVSDELILDDGHEVKVDLAGLVTRHALLDDWLGQIEPVAIGGNGAMICKRGLISCEIMLTRASPLPKRLTNRPLFQTIQLVESAFDGNVAHKVKHVIVFGRHFLVELEEVLPRERVVHRPDFVRVGERQSLHGRVERHRKLFESLEGAPEGHGLVLRVEKNREDCLRCACVLDDLLREEHLIGPVVEDNGALGIFVGNPLEKEHQSVDRLKVPKLAFIQTPELVHETINIIFDIDYSETAFKIV